MPESNKPGVDLGEIKSILDHNATRVFNGVSKGDLDWFLRDNAIDDRTFNGSTGSGLTSKATADMPSSSNAPNSLKTDPNSLKTALKLPDSPRSSLASDPKTQISPNRSTTLPKIAPASPHLTAVILNTNDNYSTKTKPSVAPIQEEPAMRLFSHSEDDDLSPHSNSSTKRKPSFFRKLKGKFMKEESPVPQPSLAQHNPEDLGPFKENYHLNTRLARTSTNIDRVSRERSSSSATNGIGPNDPDTYRLRRTMSTPLAVAHNLDPRLEEYIRFYEKGDREIGSQSRRGLMVGNFVSTEAPTSPLALAAPKTSIFHRRKSINSTSLTANMERNRKMSDSSSTNDEGSLLRLNSRGSQSEKLPPMLAHLKPLKRVAFHSSTFSIDPPQQIPLRHPRKGNVEVLADGSLRINPLSEEEREAQEKSQMGHGGGIVIGGMSSQSGKKALEGETEDPDTKVDLHALQLGIEKPMVVHKHSYLAPVKKMQLDLMYTRCCHLREILPIPTILKQIPPGLMLTIPTLQLRNPAPTMIEVQTFADFIRIAPIMCVSLDGISLSLAQFKILLLSMAAKTQLEKLSLRNTPIDSEGWLLLCWFLSRNKVLTRLDITQCPSLQVNVLKKKKKSSSTSEAEQMVRMTCNKDNRLDMDWGLFTATLAARGGIDELILTGCCIQDINEFEQLIRIGALVRTARLGLAYSNLLIKQVNILLDYWLLKPFARGIDLGYNDFLLTSFFSLFLDKLKDENFSKSLASLNLGFMSLNATNIRFLDLFQDYVLNFMTKLTNLKYLDISNNPALFGLVDLTPVVADDSKPKDDTIVSTSGLPAADVKQQEKAVSFFTLVLPLFSKLIRLHIENNNLSSESLVQIARTLPLCKNLGYFSVQGNNVNLTAAALLLQAVEYLKTLMMVDCENENLPPIVKEKLGMYMVRNMERSLSTQLARGKAHNKPNGDTGSEHNGSIADGLAEQHASLTEQLTEIISKKADHKLKLEDSEVQLFIAKTKKIRDSLLSVIDELNQLQLQNKLNIEGKEALIRFVFIEASIQRGLLLIDPSLVAEDLTEDQLKRIRIRSSAESHSAPTTDAKDDGNLSVPNGVNSNDKEGMLPRKTPLRVDLAELDRQEGKAFKFRTLRDDLIAQSGGDGNADLYNQFDEKILGEDIRKVLSFQNQEDTDTILKYLEDLRDKRVDVTRLFVDKFGEEFKEATTRANNENEYRERMERLRSQWKTMAIERLGLPKEDPIKIAALSSTGSGSTDEALQSKPSDQTDGTSKENTTEMSDPEDLRRVSTTYDAIITGLEANK